MTNEPVLLDGPRILPRSGRRPRSLVVLVHGYGADGPDLIGLGEAWSERLPDTAFVAPNAPQACEGAPFGRQWFRLSVRNPEEIRRGVSEAEPLMHAFLDRELARYGLTDNELALVGFSQGTMLALYVGPHRRRKIAGIVGYSGLIAWSLERERNAAHKPPILLIHGEKDPIIPSIALPATRLALASAGFPVQAQLCPGLDHRIDGAGLEMGGDFLRRILSRRSTDAVEAAE